MSTKPHTNDIPEEREAGAGPTPSRRLGYGAAGVGVVLLELIKVAVLAGITIGAVRYFIFKPFVVHGASMAPNFYENEYLIIDEVSYRFKEPARGDIVVLRNPHKKEEFFLKRVIGMPGERIMVRDSQVFLAKDKNTAPVALQEAYLPSREFTPGSVDITLQENEYYVLGDNRDASLDSRIFGPIPGDSIIGRVLLRGWPFDRAQRFPVPEYNI
ncbi:signal peptidase I [Candidatus Uhrbacteria bacterium RIFCSPLOWO2_02_FULL_51_9]|uniref:Signal peptidase I n=1 Tax=Candidatus Uhrbacteria bacterium RIFCSPLOWO2_02_FULL_51_9 TaxID=1802410 RepID=A0A1F7VDL3_9BACT|nr:MAG: signal peptidase I [Candidatus Uhrbacteria bacterium RIFCSPLOWO2_02_FULL_51_9]